MTSLFRLIKEKHDLRLWNWLRIPGDEFSELISPFLKQPGFLQELSTPLSSVARVFYLAGESRLLIVAEPEPISPSPFAYEGDRLTVGYLRNDQAIAEAVNLLKVEIKPSESNADFATAAASLHTIVEYSRKVSVNTLQQRCLRAVQPDVKLEKEGSELYEFLTTKLQALFRSDYLEIQFQKPSIFWSDRNEDWTWIHTSSTDFQWPVTVAYEQEWELYRSGMVMIINDIVDCEGIVIAEQPGGKCLTSGLLIPLVVRGKKLGMLKLLFARQILQSVNEEEVLNQFQDGFSRLIERTGDFLRTQRMAMIDGLTDLFNQRFFNTQLRNEFQRGLRYHSPMTLIMIDIDDFKVYNDSYGHQAGNKVLAWVARKIRSSVRDIDFVARYGGEEFALILPEIRAEDGLIVAEKIRKAISSEIVVSDTGERLRPITVSCGVTDNRKAQRPEEMVEQADQALYWVKRNGRNLVRLAETNT